MDILPLIVVDNFAGIRIHSAHDHLADRGFTASRFTDNGQTLTARHVKTDMIDSGDSNGRLAAAHAFIADGKTLGQIAHLQDRLGRINLFRKVSRLQKVPLVRFDFTQRDQARIAAMIKFGHGIQ